MLNIQYKRGEFQVFRATRSLHLGSPLEKDITKDAVLEFDGQTVRGSGFSADMPQIRSAITSGWFVLDGSMDPVPAPVRPAGVTMHPAQSTGPVRGAAIEVKTVHAEERDLGNLKQVRDRGDGAVRREARDQVAQPVKDTTTFRNRKVFKVDEDDAVPVATIRSAAKKAVTTVSPETVSRLTQEVNRLDNAPVQKAVVVKRDVLDEILPEQSSRVVGKVKPVAAARIDEADEVSEEEREALRAEKAERLAAATEQASAARAARLASMGVEAKPLPVVKAAAPVVKAPVPVQRTPAPVVVEEIPVEKEILDMIEVSNGDAVSPARLALVQDAIPDFEWDMSRPRDERIEMALLIDDALFLNGILAVEVPEVKAKIKLGIATR